MDTLRAYRDLMLATTIVAAVLAVGLTACAPPVSAATCSVRDRTGATHPTPASLEDFGIDCSTGGTVTVWVELHGPLAGRVLEPIAYPVLDVDEPPSPLRNDFAIVDQRSDNPDCDWRRSDDGQLWVHCDSTPDAPFLTSVTIDLGNRPGVIGLSGPNASTIRGLS